MDQWYESRYGIQFANFFRKGNRFIPTHPPPDAGRAMAMSSAAEVAGTDCELLEQFQRSDDQSAFSALVQRYQALVLGTALRRTGDRELSREVAQEVFATLARKARLLSGHASLGGWLHRATVYQASRTIVSEQRRRARNEQYHLEGTAGVVLPAGSSSGEDRLAFLDDALNGLSAPDREVLVLHYLQDLSYPEMSKSLGLTEAAARQRVSRALDRLAKRLRETGVTVNATVLLLGAVAMQSSIAAPVALAQSALALAAASGTSSGYLFLTGLLSPPLLKKAAVLTAATTLTAIWYQDAPVSSASLEAAGSRAAAEMVAERSMGDFEPAVSAQGAVREAAVPVSTSLLARQDQPAEPTTSPSRTSPRINLPRGSYFAAAPPPAVQPPLAVPVMMQPSTPRGVEQKRDSTDRKERSRPVSPLDPDYRFPGALEEIGEIGGLPAVVDRLQEAELEPPIAAELYSLLLGDLLDLELVDRLRLEELLRPSFEQLKQVGGAGRRPADVPEPLWEQLREEPVRKVLEDIEDVVGPVAPITEKILGGRPARPKEPSTGGSPKDTPEQAARPGLLKPVSSVAAPLLDAIAPVLSGLLGR